MGERTAIQWTDATWNPWRGCHRVSPGCAKCYAERLMTGLMGQDFSKVTRAAPATFRAPLRWAKDGKPRRVFTCSISDFFIEEADAWREEVWEIIRKTPTLTYQILTKRPERIASHLPKDWGAGYPNVWLGTSVESQPYMHRVRTLLAVPAKLRFLSLEPLLGPLQFEADMLGGIGWMITGGESDRNPRPADPAWFRSIRDVCTWAKIPYFHKQDGGSKKCECHGAWGCRLLNGRTWDEFPRG